jgi:O-antigen/teichoic acid export membrane protein
MNFSKSPVSVLLAHALRMFANLVVLKLVALAAGPQGLGVLGNLMSATSIISNFAGGGIGGGITKYVAEYRARPTRLLRFVRSAMVYGCIVSVLFFLLTLVWHKSLALFFFGDGRLLWLPPLLGLAQFLCFVGTAIVAVFNGAQRSDLFVKVSILAYLSVIPVAYGLIVVFGVVGASVSLLLMVSCTSLPALYYLFKLDWFRLLKFKIDKRDVVRLSAFSLMVLASALFFPLAEIFVRGLVSATLGYEQAGVWQALNKLSGAYLGFFGVFLSTQYMPKLSALIKKQEILTVVYRHLMGGAVCFVVFAVIFYLAKSFLIELLFSKSFLSMTDLVLYQLVGDFFRFMSYVIGFLGVAKAAVRLYICAELVQTGLFSSLSWLVMQHDATLLGVVQAYMLTYIAYFFITVACLIFYAKRAL